MADIPTEPSAANGHEPPIRRNPAAPRPVPVAFDMAIEVFLNPETQQRKVMVRDELHMPTGITITYWDPDSLKRRIAQMRSMLSEAVQAESQGAGGIITPSSGLLIPPGSANPPPPPSRN